MILLFLNFSMKVAYTFDAGPNACIYLLNSEVNRFVSVLNLIFPSDRSANPEYIRGLPVASLTTADEVIEIFFFYKLICYI